MSLDVHRLNVVIRHTLIHPEQQTKTDATPGFIIRTIICTIPAFKTPKKQTPVSLMFSQLTSGYLLHAVPRPGCDSEQSSSSSSQLCFSFLNLCHLAAHLKAQQKPYECCYNPPRQASPQNNQPHRWSCTDNCCSGKAAVSVCLSRAAHGRPDQSR